MTRSPPTTKSKSPKRPRQQLKRGRPSKAASLVPVVEKIHPSKLSGVRVTKPRSSKGYSPKKTRSPQKKGRQPKSHHNVSTGKSTTAAALQAKTLKFADRGVVCTNETDLKASVDGSVFEPCDAGTSTAQIAGERKRGRRPSPHAQSSKRRKNDPEPATETAFAYNTQVYKEASIDCSAAPKDVTKKSDGVHQSKTDSVNTSVKDNTSDRTDPGAAGQSEMDSDSADSGATGSYQETKGDSKDVRDEQGEEEVDYSLEVEYPLPSTPQQKMARQLVRQRQLNEMRVREAALAREERLLRRQGLWTSRTKSTKRIQWKNDLVQIFTYSQSEEDLLEIDVVPG